MATIDLTDATFNEVVETNPIVVIDFWAEWCGPCRMFAPVYERASDDPVNAGVVFAKVDTEDQPALASAFNIRSIPTLAVFRDQVLVYSQPGALPEPALADLLVRIKALDMDEVRAALEQAEHAPRADGAVV